jgi:hypothetical protein
MPTATKKAINTPQSTTQIFQSKRRVRRSGAASSWSRMAARRAGAYSPVPTGRPDHLTAAK